MLKRVPRSRSQIGVPLMRSVYWEPVPVLSYRRPEYWVSRNRLFVATHW